MKLVYKATPKQRQTLCLFALLLVKFGIGLYHLLQ